MMISSRDELIRGRHGAGRQHQPSAGDPRQTPSAARLLGADRAGQHHRPARPVRLRQDHADALHRRHPDRDIGDPSPCSATRRLRRAAAPGRLPAARPDDLQRSAGRSTTFATSRRSTASTARPQTPRSSGSGLTDHRTAFCAQPLRRPAHPGFAGVRVGLPAGSAGARRAHRRPGPGAARRTSGSSSPTLARAGTTLLVSSHVMDEADHCGDLLLMREASLVAHTTPTQLREDTGCTSLEDAFLSIIKRNTMRQAG